MCEKSKKENKWREREGEKEEKRERENEQEVAKRNGEIRRNVF